MQQYYFMLFSAIFRVFIVNQVNADLTFTFFFLFLDSYGIAESGKVESAWYFVLSMKEKI